MRRASLGLFIVLLFFSLTSTVFSDGYTDVTVEEAKTMIDSNPSLVVLDVRAQSEYDSGHLRYAKLIPHTELESRLDELNINDHILVYCKLGGRSAFASQILVDNDFTHVSNMLGGITDWLSYGYPVYVKYPSIQQAINNASVGDKILVSSGTYTENIIVNKTVSLIGENQSTTVIDANMTSGQKHAVIYVNSSNVLISDFTLRNCSNGDGVSVQYAGNITVCGNTIAENEGRGIHVDPTSTGNINITNNIISNNSIIGGWGAINLLASNNVVHRNIVTNHEVGILVQVNTNNSTITENTISNNGLGIDRHNGWTHDNFVCHNNFINNTFQTDVEPTSNDTWDNGCEGNYWSDYAGADSDGDGIGDIPYLIDLNNTDNYPLMNPYWTPADINHDLEVDIYDVVTVCMSYGSTPSDSNWNCHCDITEPYGAIDIYDIVLMTTSYGEEYSP